MDEYNHGSKQPDSVSAVLRVFSILTALSEHKDTSISQLSALSLIHIFSKKSMP